MSDIVICSLVYLFRDNQVNLPVAKLGPTAGKRSSYGGKLDPGETIYECGIREVLEETNGTTIIESMQKAGVMTFHWDRKVDVPGLNRPGQSIVEVHIYTSRDWQGEPQLTTAFGDPSWFNCDQPLPYQEMMPCEQMWFSQLLLGEEFTGKMHYCKVDGQIFCRSAHLNKRIDQPLLTKP